MLTGTIIYRTKHYTDGTPYNAIYQIEGADTLASITTRISTHDYEAIGVMNGDPKLEELQLRRFNINTGTCKVETVKYTDENGKEKPRPVNNEFFVRLAATIRYAKTMCTSKNSEDYTGIAMATTDFEPAVRRKYNIPDGDGYTIGSVVLDKGAIVEMHLDTPLFKIDIEDKATFDMEAFNDFTIAKNVGFKIDEEHLGFNPLCSGSSGIVSEYLTGFDSSVSSLLYKNLDEVIKYHPEREFEWLRGKNYIIVTDDTLEEICDKIYNHDGYVAYDTETTGLKINFLSREGRADICVGIVLSVESGTSYFFPCNMRSIPNLCGGDDKYFMTKYMKPILEEKELIAHNMSFDWKVAYIYDINANIVHDTMPLFKLTYGAERENFPMGLKELTRMFLNRDSLELSDLVRDGSWGDDENIKFWDLPEELVRYYAPADTDNTLDLFDYAMKADLLHKYNAQKVYEIEIAFSLAVAYQEFMGHCADMNRVEDLKRDVEKGLEDTMKAMEDMVGHPFNPNSPKDLIQVMYKELGIPEQISRKTGRPTTDKAALKALSNVKDENDKCVYPFVELLTEFRAFDGLRKNFIKNLPELCTEDGFLFSSVMQYGTTTGRVSINKPNYQSYNDTIKKYIIPRKGYYATDQDYSSVEYRVLGNMSGNTMIKEGFKDPDFDYHQYQAARMYGIPYASVTPKLRKQAKGINFGLPYGMGDESLGAAVFGDVSEENTRKAAALRTKYFEGQEDIRDFFDKARASGVKNGFTETYFGRRRYYHKNKFSVAAIRRQAGNQVIQGSAADIYKLAVGRLFKRICKEGWLGKVLFTAFVHDEIFCEVHNSIDPMKWLKVSKEEFEVKIDGWCPLYMGFGFGMSWYEAKHVELPIGLQQEFIDNYGITGYPKWHGDGEELCASIPDLLRDFAIRDTARQLQLEESQGHMIKPALNKSVWDTLGEDSEIYKRILSEDKDTESILKKLNENHIDNILYDDEGNMLTEVPKCDDTQVAITWFCKLHSVDRSKINVLNIEESSGENLNTASTKNYDYTFDDDEYEDNTKEELEMAKAARIKQLGLYLDYDENTITLNYDVPQNVIMFIQGKCTDKQTGYRIQFRSFVQNKLFVTDKYLPSDEVSIVQEMYIKILS